MGCNFCTTSAFFGGKGKFLNFYQTGEELFDVMCEMEASMKVRSFFIMDENFLLLSQARHGTAGAHEGQGKAWALYVFSSANAISKYTMRELVELGVSWIWMGLESPHSGYAKLQGHDTLALTQELRRHGIKLLGSTIVGLEHHTPREYRGGDRVCRRRTRPISTSSCCTRRCRARRSIRRCRSRTGCWMSIWPTSTASTSSTSGTPRFRATTPNSFLDWAFLRDFERNGPSLYRICRTTMEGWKRYSSDPDARVRERFAWEIRSIKMAYSGLLWAMERQLRRTNEATSQQIRALRQEMGREFGIVPRVMAGLLGPVLLWTSRREQRQLAQGKTYEPRMFVEHRNWIRE